MERNELLLERVSRFEKWGDLPPRFGAGLLRRDIPRLSKDRFYPLSFTDRIERLGGSYEVDFALTGDAFYLPLVEGSEGLVVGHSPDLTPELAYLIESVYRDFFEVWDTLEDFPMPVMPLVWREGKREGRVVASFRSTLGAALDSRAYLTLEPRYIDESLFIIVRTDTHVGFVQAQEGAVFTRGQNSVASALLDMLGKPSRGSCCGVGINDLLLHDLGGLAFDEPEGMSGLLDRLSQEHPFMRADMCLDPMPSELLRRNFMHLVIQDAQRRLSEQHTKAHTLDSWRLAAGLAANPPERWSYLLEESERKRVAAEARVEEVRKATGAHVLAKERQMKADMEALRVEIQKEAEERIQAAEARLREIELEVRVLRQRVQLQNPSEVDVDWGI